jgi:hypothetical protein
MSKPTRPDRQGTEKWAAKAEQYIDALEAENAELRESVQFNKDVAAEQARDYLDTYAKLKRAVKLLRTCRPYLNLVNNDDGRNVDSFLSEMEEPGNENPCPKCGRYHLTECEEDTHE